MSVSPSPGRAHVAALHAALDRFDPDHMSEWGRRLAGVLRQGGRLLAAGNGGSAARAQHLTAELVGRCRDERPALSALALHSDTSSLTAIANDYGYDAGFARQVEAHGRSGDVLIALSTSGRSPNLLAAARTARALEMTTWALTGPAPNPLADACDDAIYVEAAGMATVHEVHQVALHLLCAAVDDALLAGAGVPMQPEMVVLT